MRMLSDLIMHLLFQHIYICTANARFLLGKYLKWLLYALRASLALETALEFFFLPRVRIIQRIVHAEGRKEQASRRTIVVLLSVRLGNCSRAHNYRAPRRPPKAKGVELSAPCMREVQKKPQVSSMNGRMNIAPA